MTILDGRALAAEIKADIKTRALKLKNQAGLVPGLAVILVGADPASAIYTAMKQRACLEMGFHSPKFDLPAEISEAELIERIEALNADPAIHGILVQLPLPAHIDADQILSHLDPTKDVDGLHPRNLGDILIGKERLLPATPKGIMRLLEHYQIDTEGKHVVIVGRSNILGKPLAAMFLNRNATVTVCHSKTTSLEYFTRQADILISDTGVAGLIKGTMVKEGVVAVDAGISKVGHALVGDLEFSSVSSKASYLTPVPGGVGPMTIAMLLENTLALAQSSTLKEN